MFDDDDDESIGVYTERAC